ncbi:MAG: DUF4328 domain-containing protein [Myxococcales bacterium]|nr:DUF4328 domain-containing protein [Myxococcales bacterium]
MSTSDSDNVYQAPEADAALPSESERPMRWLVVALDVCLAVSVATQVSLLIAFYAYGGSIWAMPPWALELGAISGYAYYAGCLIFLIFVYRAHRNARALGVRKLRVSSLGAVVRFLLPLANLYLGYVVVRDLWKYSDKPHTNSPLVHYWWLAVLAYPTVGYFASGVVGAVYPDLVRWTVVTLSIAAAFLTSRVVHGIQARQAARARRIAAE